MKKATIRQAFLNTIPILTGYVCLGFGFGILMQQAGYCLWWGLAMSLFIYAGSMQYVAVGLLTGGVGLLTTALTTLVVNARHLFYGISMVDNYKGTGRKKPYLIFALTDETYSLVAGGTVPAGCDKHLYWLLVSAMNQCYWVTGTLLGGLVGNVLKINYAGIDFALTALFVTIFTEQWLTAKDHRPALIGLGASVGSLLLFGSESFLIPAMLTITAGLLLLRRWEGKHNG